MQIGALICGTNLIERQIIPLLGADFFKHNKTNLFDDFQMRISVSARRSAVG